MRYKTCSTCRVEKSTSDFHKNVTKLDGLKHQCKVCVKKQRDKYYADNKQDVLDRNSAWQDRNKDYMKKYSYSYYRANKLYYFASVAKRRAKKLKATPPWLTECHFNEIKNFYWLAKDLTAVSGESYHVDHIVPLQGKNVCGLHVPWNLQVLPSDINLSKGNRYADDA